MVALPGPLARLVSLPLRPVPGAGRGGPLALGGPPPGPVELALLERRVLLPAGRGRDSHARLQEGILPIPAFLEQLTEHRFTGSVSLELDLRPWMNDPGELRSVLTSQRRYVEEWVAVLARLHPEASTAACRARAHALFGLINSTPHSAGRVARPAMAGLLAEMAMAAALA